MPDNAKANLRSAQIMFVGFVFCFAFVHLFGQAMFVAVVIPYVFIFEGETVSAEFLERLIEFGQESFQTGFKYGWASTIFYAGILIAAVFGFGLARKNWQSILSGLVSANLVYWLTIYALIRLELGEPELVKTTAPVLLMWAAAATGGAANGWVLALGARSLDRRAAAKQQ